MALARFAAVLLLLAGVALAGSCPFSALREAMPALHGRTTAPEGYAEALAAIDWDQLKV